MLNINSWRSHPTNGWIYCDCGEKKYLLPPNAYSDEMDWIKSIREIYPDKVDKVLNIFDNNLQHGFQKVLVDKTVCRLIEFLNKNL